MSRVSKGAELRHLRTENERLEMLLGAAVIERHAAIRSSEVYYGIAVAALGQKEVEYRKNMVLAREAEAAKGGEEDERDDNRPSE